MSLVKLEPICAEYATQLVENSENTAMNDKENVITKALGVLSENGLYSMAVFLVSCHKREYGETVLQFLCGLWAHDNIGLLNSSSNDTGAMLQSVRGLTKDLSSLIIAKKLAEQTLVFARYHAKALG